MGTPTAAKEKTLAAEVESGELVVSSPAQRGFFIAQVALRIMAVLFTLIAISVMVTGRQSVVLFGFVFTARYNDSSANRFLVGADSVVCAFSALSLIPIHLLSRSGARPRSCFLLFLHDMIMMILMISGCSAATAIGFVGKYGEERMDWLPVCDRVTKFCNRVLIGVVFSYLASLVFFALTIISARKLMAGAH